ncbi:Holliday junction branch migration protein RuvA [Virgibacillus halodenitrificans]|uniref:Holliday junction branch migration protein RuvA n=1 Tax=Virgibacillus halodenitrificans TaxID=1482 RepID=UPI00045CC370|nr:Holliday junction branch migration protein RuvA [Virgibacillus halodenitrificans]CDQ35379.1 Holliday junction ATP-dependent DNA helicase RuvA [Virgibacillus halodenitrificans]
MIAYIKGNLTYLQDESVIVEVQGIGYEIICANPFVFQHLLNKEVLISTYHYVREDIQVLYGFKDEDQKYLFTKLISVSGIGPKGALAVLGTVNVADFVGAIEREDDKYLTSFPGVGKKTARQIILDLKGKLTTMISISSTDSDHELQHKEVNQNLAQLDEAKEALKALGYTDREIKSVLPKLPNDENNSTDTIIRKALALLMKN